MKLELWLIILIVGLLLFGAVVSAATLYYSPTCPHCKNVLPYIQIIPDVKLCDINNPIDREVQGVPTLILDDGTIISGDKPILDYLSTQPFYSKTPMQDDKKIGTKTINHIVYEVWQNKNGRIFLGRDIASS